MTIGPNLGRLGILAVAMIVAVPFGANASSDVSIVTDPPVIDGRLDERVWALATPTSDFRLVGLDRAAAEDTEVRLLTDHQFLYVAITCRDPFPQRIVAFRQPTLDQFWSRDHVTVEFGSMTTPLERAAVSVNPAGAALSVGLRDDEWLRASTTGESGWSTEMAIPLAAIGGRPGALNRRVEATRYHARTGESSQGELGVTARGIERVVAGEASPDRAPVRRFEPTVSQHTLVASDYVWRGFVVDRGTVLQPTFTFSAGNVTVSSWSNVVGRTARVSEHDLTVDYLATRGPYVFSVGWINYAFPQMTSDAMSNEFYVGVGRTGLLNPTAHLYHDVQAGSGRYVHLGVSETLELFDGVMATPSFGMGYNDRLFIPESTFSDAVLALNVSIATPFRSLSVEPFLAYSRSLNRRFFENKLYGGVGVVLGEFAIR